MKRFYSVVIVVLVIILGAPAMASVLWQADSATVIATSTGEGGWIFEITSGGTIVATCNNEQLTVGTCEDAMQGLSDITGRMPLPDEDVIAPNIGVVEQVLPPGELSGGSDQDPTSDSDPPADQDPATDGDPSVSALGNGNACIPTNIEYPVGNTVSVCLLEVPNQGDSIDLAGVGSLVVFAPPLWTISSSGIDLATILTMAAE